MMTKRCVFLLALLSVLCLPSLAMAEISGLAVFDDNGKRVGPVIGTKDSGSTAPNVWFSFETNEELVTLLVDLSGDGLTGMGPKHFFFESTDCSGPPLIHPNGPGLWPDFLIVGGPNPGQLGGGGDNIIYGQDPNDIARPNITPRSQTLTTAEDCDPPPSGTSDAIKVKAILDIDTVFTRPFHIESDDVPDMSSVQAQLDTLQEQLNNHYHKLKLGRRFRLPTGPPIFPDTP